MIFNLSGKDFCGVWKLQLTVACKEYYAVCKIKKKYIMILQYNKRNLIILLKWVY